MEFILCLCSIETALSIYDMICSQSCQQLYLHIWFGVSTFLSNQIIILMSHLKLITLMSHLKRITLMSHLKRIILMSHLKRITLMSHLKRITLMSHLKVHTSIIPEHESTK